MSKKQTTDYRHLIREAADLLHQEVEEYNRLIGDSDCDSEVFSFFDLGVLYTNIMAKEKERNSIIWESALITVMESSLLVFSGYGFHYVEPDIPECEFKYKYFKKLISKKRNPVIKIFSSGRLRRYRGIWHCYSIWQ